jgi:pimeloyl-ACP methyl ester carboxylesterase
MKISAALAAPSSLVLAVVACTFPTVRSALVLSESVMKLVKESARLSELAYEETAPDDTVTHDYSTFGYFDDEPDQALVVKTTDGYCYVAFRGTSLTFDDWGQNLELGNMDVCIQLDGVEKCCTSRIGFFHAYDAKYRTDVEDSVRECAKSCPNKDECVVITGHSQGGAVAAVAALLLADLNPTVITFGQPPTVNAPCDLLTTDRIYRFVNTKDTDVGIAYDPVPMAPGLGADHFGNMIILSDDPTGVAFIGLDANEYFHPFLNGVEAHFMRANGTDYPGYADRIDALMGPKATYPIRNNVSSSSRCGCLSILFECGGWLGLVIRILI